MSEELGTMRGARLPGRDLVIPMTLELEDLIEGFDAILGGFSDSIEEEVEPAGKVIVIPDTGEALVIFLAIAFEVVG